MVLDQIGVAPIDVHIRAFQASLTPYSNPMAVAAARESVPTSVSCALCLIRLTYICMYVYIFTSPVLWPGMTCSKGQQDECQKKDTHLANINTKRQAGLEHVAAARESVPTSVSCALCLIRLTYICMYVYIFTSPVLWPGMTCSKGQQDECQKKDTHLANINTKRQAGLEHFHFHGVVHMTHCSNTASTLQIENPSRSFTTSVLVISLRPHIYTGDWRKLENMSLTGPVH